MPVRAFYTVEGIRGKGTDNSNSSGNGNGVACAILLASGSEIVSRVMPGYAA